MHTSLRNSRLQGSSPRTWVMVGVIAWFGIVGCNMSPTTYDVPITPEQITEEETEGAASTEIDPTLANGPLLTDVSPLVAAEGSRFTMTGEGLADGMQIQIRDETLDLQVDSPSSASFVLPAGITGRITVKIVEPNVTGRRTEGATDGGTAVGATPSATLVENEAPATELVSFEVIILAPGQGMPDSRPEDICAGTAFIDATGSRSLGTRDCSAPVPENCAAGGAIGCLTTDTFPAANSSGLADRVAIGQRVAGVSGTNQDPADPDIVDCSATLRQNCFVRGDYRAAQLCGDGEDNCVLPRYDSASQPRKAVDVDAVAAGQTAFASSLTIAGVSGQLASCTSNDETGCITDESFVAAAPGTSLMANTAFPGPGYYTGLTGLPTAGNITTDARVLGINGTKPTTSVVCSSSGQQGCIATSSLKAGADCSSSGAVDCITTASFVAGAPRGNLDFAASFPGSGYYSSASNIPTSDQIKSGQTILGVVGEYPSASHPLPGADGATADLVSSDYTSQIISGSSFEYWDSSGGRHTSTGSSDIAASNITTGVDIFGQVGEAMPAMCIATAKATCEAVSTCRWQSGACEINPWHIRAGIVIAGQTGTLKTNCRNKVLSSVYNQDGLPDNLTGATGTALDWWDTVDDNASPLDEIAGGLVAGWSTDNVCSKEVWTDLTDDGAGDTACDEGTDDCMFLNNLSGLVWSESFPVSGLSPTSATGSWSAGVVHCDTLSFGGHSDWRLPTAHEISMVAFQGISMVGFSGGTERPGGDVYENNGEFINNVDTRYSSATTISHLGHQQWNTRLAEGNLSLNTKTSQRSIICVRTP